MILLFIIIFLHLVVQVIVLMSDSSGPEVKFCTGVDLFVLRFYGPVNPMGSCRARSVYLTTHYWAGLVL